MSAEVLDGRAIAGALRERVRSAVASRVGAGHRPPGLATVLVGDDPASHVYVASKLRACEEAGIQSIHHELAATTGQDDLIDLVATLDDDPGVDGILVQLPLPGSLEVDPVLAEISAHKDVDGLTPANAGLLAQGRIGVAEALDVDSTGAAEPVIGLIPCTPAGVIEVLHSAGVELAGAEAVVVGRSNLVGRPLMSLLVGADATVTLCHSRTRDLASICRRADVLIAAVGRPEMIGAEWVKPGATVIDVGMNRTEGGLVGDVDFGAVAAVAGRITPVPGGVGPMTIAMLLANTVRAARPHLSG